MDNYKDFIDGYKLFTDSCKNKFKVYSILYEGKGISLNDFYNSSHWSKRHFIKSKYKPIFLKLLKDSIGENKIDKFSIIMEYNSRHDVDNVIGTEKILVDALKIDKEGNGWIIDDSKKHYKMFCIMPNLDLPNNTFKFLIIDLSNGDKK